MTQLRKSLAWINDIETLVCEWLLALFVLLLFAQIASRQLFNKRPRTIGYLTRLALYRYQL